MGVTVMQIAVDGSSVELAPFPEWETTPGTWRFLEGLSSLVFRAMGVSLALARLSLTLFVTWLLVAQSKREEGR